MPLIPTVGRKSAKMRLVVAFIYLALIFGAATTVYPFLVMLGSSVTSDYDQDKYDIVPRYLTSTSSLFGKYACDKYGQDLPTLNAAYRQNYAKLDSIVPPKGAIDRAGTARWESFFAGLPSTYRMAGFRATQGQYSPSALLDRYHGWLKAGFRGDIRVLDKSYVEEDTDFLTVYPPYERPSQRLFALGASTKERDWISFESTLPVRWFYPVLIDPLYQSYLHDQVYGGKIDALNGAWHTSYAQWTEIALTANVPASGQQRTDWTGFVRTKVPLRFVRLGDGATSAWSAFLAARHLPVVELPALGTLPVGPTLQAYSDFIKQIAPQMVTVESTENLWRAKTRDPNAAPPLAEEDYAAVLANHSALRWDFVTRNYRFALDYLMSHGNGIWNTVIYCAGAVLAALIVNPLCAYALSRFKLPYTQSILLFLLATMAFPAEVAMIPNFLLLKDLGLLNTFWALILPGAASGYSIFLLKGFFDSLPQDLYEAGMLDGASELTLFRKVTLPLSKPIFAVIALQAFTAAYGAFLFAMILCQAQSHWTMMVWIYEFQALDAPQYVTLAALVIAALPTLIVFLFTQNIIMRGIILPSMK